MTIVNENTTELIRSVDDNDDDSEAHTHANDILLLHTRPVQSFDKNTFRF